MARIRGRSNTTSGTARSPRRCATRSWRRIGSKGSGRTEAAPNGGTEGRNAYGPSSVGQGHTGRAKGARVPCTSALLLDAVPEGHPQSKGTAGTGYCGAAFVATGLARVRRAILSMRRSPQACAVAIPDWNWRAQGGPLFLADIASRSKKRSRTETGPGRQDQQAKEAFLSDHINRPGLCRLHDSRHSVAHHSFLVCLLGHGHF
jgi:hypothetical protein